LEAWKIITEKNNFISNAYAAMVFSIVDAIIFIPLLF